MSEQITNLINYIALVNSQLERTRDTFTGDISGVLTCGFSEVFQLQRHNAHVQYRSKEENTVKRKLQDLWELTFGCAIHIDDQGFM